MGRYRQPYSLYKRGKFYYYKTYREDGTRTAGKSTGCTSKGAAKMFCDKLYLRGELFHNDINFKAYADNFFDENGLYFSNNIKTYSLNTIRIYQNALKNAIMPYFENTNIQDITYSKLKIFRTYLLNNYSMKTASGTMNVLKIILQTAYRDRLLPDNPFNYLEPIPQQASKQDAFTLEEVKELYKKSSEEFKKGILCIALCGLRISEYFGLMLNEIKTADHNGTTFEYVDLKMQNNRGTIMPVKSGSYRQLPIIPEIKELTDINYSRYCSWFLELKKLIKEFKDAESRHLSFHSLRHFFITNAKSNGIAPIKVEYIAGHKLQGIEKVYTNFKASDVTEILEWQKKTFAIITEQD